MSTSPSDLPASERAAQGARGAVLAGFAAGCATGVVTAAVDGAIVMGRDLGPVARVAWVHALVLHAGLGAVVGSFAGLWARRLGRGGTMRAAAVATLVTATALCAAVAVDRPGDMLAFRPGRPWRSLWTLLGSLAVIAVIVALVRSAARRASVSVALASLGPAVLVVALAVGLARTMPGLPPAPEGAAAREPGPPNVVVVMLDTVRADAVTGFGAPEDATPHTAAFAERATRYTDCMAPGTWTVPSHASLFTGLPVRGHGCRLGLHMLPTDVPVLAEEFRRGGWATIGRCANRVLPARGGWARGFESWKSGRARYHDPLLRGAVRRALRRFGVESQPLRSHTGPFRGGGGDIGDMKVPAQFDPDAQTVHESIAAMRRWARNDDRPLFLFVNLIGAHEPYHPDTDPHSPDGLIHRPRSYRGPHARLRPWTQLGPRDYAWLRRLYADEVARADRHVGRLLDEIERLGETERTVIAIVGDHGDLFGEDPVVRLGHVHSVLPAITHVPALLAGPGVPEGRVDDRPVMLQDFAPTLLRLAGLPDDAMRAGDALPLVGDGGPTDDRVRITEELPTDMILDRDVDNPVRDFVQRLSLVAANGRAAWRRGDGDDQWIDWPRGTQAGPVPDLVGALDVVRARPLRGEGLPPDPESLRQARMHGYLGGGR